MSRIYFFRICYIISIHCFFILIEDLYAQHLSLNQAIDSAMDRNLGLQVLRNNVSITGIENSWGLAGALPLVQSSITHTNALQGIHQELSNGIIINRNNVASQNVNANINASILLYNGYRVKHTKSRLESAEILSKMNIELASQNLLYEVHLAYYNIIKAESQLIASKERLNYIIQKDKLIQQRIAIGLANEIDRLQVQVDLQSSQIELDELHHNVHTAKTTLLQLMQSKSTIEFSIDSIIEIDESITKESALSKIAELPDNIVMQLLVQMEQLKEREIAAQKYPSLRLNTAYTFNNATSSAGFNLLNQNYGPNAGLSLTIPIYNGHVIRDAQKISKLHTDNNRLYQQMKYNDLYYDIIKTYDDYSNNIIMMKQYDQKYESTKNLMELILKNFSLGQSTLLDLQSAETNLALAATQRTNSRYLVKIAETKLKRYMLNLK